MQQKEVEKISKKKREDYLREISNYSPEELIFLDEAGVNLQMHPIYGRGLTGERIVYSAPYQRGHKMTMIGAISVEKIEAAMYGSWAANGEIFTHFMEGFLGPALDNGKIVIMDNVSFHSAAGIKELIESRGAKLIYLPPYSPDLNPIENMWSKIKNSLRKTGARTYPSFSKAIKQAFVSVAASDLRGWFEHCGYGSVI